MTVCDRGEGSKIIKNSVTYFMDGPTDICMHQLINYRVATYDEQNLNDKCSPGGVKKKVSF